MTELFDGPFDPANEDHLRAIYTATGTGMELATEPVGTDEEEEANADAFGALMTSIVHKGPLALHASCLALCHFAETEVDKRMGPGENPRNWGFMDVGEMDEDPAGLFAARFLIAYLNDDLDTATDLFIAAAEPGPDQAVEAHLALLKQVVELIRTDFMVVPKDSELFGELVEKLGLEETAPDDASALADAADESTDKNGEQ